jgi:SpoVK/Ycf46/Vps4 family AAA+-type ATPase
MTRSQTIAADIAALLRARNPLLWIVTREEARAEAAIFEAAASVRYMCRTWDCAQGFTNLDGSRYGRDEDNDPAAALETIRRRTLATSTDERGVFVMRDLDQWLTGPIGMNTTRALRNLTRILPSIPSARAQAVIVLSPTAEVPAQLAGHATVIEWPLPDRDEIAAILDAAIAALPENMREAAAPNGNRDAAIDAAVGLSGEEAAACFAKSLVQTRKIDPAAVAKEKKRVIGKDKLLEWFDPLPGGLDAVGGLDNLKSWLITRRSAYTRQAREYGLPAPKGVLLVGVPGCGKSLSAKAIATSWQVPLLRLDLGALKSKYVGESEGNLRKAFQVIESVGRCVVWLDEIEKALAGAVQGGADGGVSSDALGTILSWMQDRTGEAFIVATSNDISKLPPELLRKGRFDELFFVDLPNAQERAEILAAALRQHKREPIMDLTSAVAATDTFTGSEIAALVPDAMFAAFNDNARAITADDIVTAAQTVTPLAVTAADRISNLRRLVAGKARPATSPTAAQESKSTRTLDF